jgi:hypothetical protein
VPAREPGGRRPRELDAGPFGADVASFRLHLAAENKAPGTIRIYTQAPCFRHTWLGRGGAEGDLMELNGWSSPQMLLRYGGSARARRQGRLSCSSRPGHHGDHRGRRARRGLLPVCRLTGDTGRQQVKLCQLAVPPGKAGYVYGQLTWHLSRRGPWRRARRGPER